MIFYKTDEEIERIRTSSHLVCQALALVGEMLKPGVTGKKIDKAAEEFIRDNGGVPAFKGYKGFPATLCVSPNEFVVHGIPSDREFEEGDIVSVDCGVLKGGYFGDSAFTFAIGEVDESVMHLLRVTNTSLYKGIDNLQLGKRLGDVSFAIQDYVQREHNFAIVRELVGHGIGKSLHEEPEVPNYGKRGKGVKLLPGLVIAIEPMVNMIRKDVATIQDGWGVVSRDKKPSAHFEHTVALRETGPDILSDHSYIMAAISKNPNLKEIEVFETV